MVDDIVTRLRDTLCSCAEAYLDDDCDACKAADEIERLRAVVDAVDDLHGPDHVDNPRCTECGEWPCSTHIIVCQEHKDARRG